MYKSLIYRNIFIYRLLMNLIYFGKYKRRFERINKLIKTDTKNVIELCFGDTYIAEFCKKMDIQWRGYDLNENFVTHAKKKGFNAFEKNIAIDDKFLKCDTYIIIGSLYQFKDKGRDLIRKMIESSKQVIISEPVENLSATKGIIGYIAKKSTNAGNGHEEFRYDEQSFIAMMDTLKVQYKIISIDKDILIEIQND